MAVERFGDCTICIGEGAVEVSSGSYSRRWAAETETCGSVVRRARYGAVGEEGLLAEVGCIPVSDGSSAARNTPPCPCGASPLSEGSETRGDGGKLPPSERGVAAVPPGEVFRASPTAKNTAAHKAGGLRVRVFPELPGSILEAPEGGEPDEYVWDARHVRLVEISMMDQTDRHNELLTEREWLLWPSEAPFSLTCPVLAVEDSLTGRGRVFLRLAPLPHARVGRSSQNAEGAPTGVEENAFPVSALGVARSTPPGGCAATPLSEGGLSPVLSPSPDFEVLPREGRLRILRTGYPVAEIDYEGGRIGRIRALHAVQRRIRRYEPGRDGLFMSNTWGDRSRDARINEEFLLGEVEAGAALGVDVVQIDDGWERGRSANSAAVAAGRAAGVWNGYWDFDPHFWDADPVRFPRGLAPVVDAARAHGMKFGLWFAPDSSDDARNWRRDADRILELHRKEGIDYIKVDSLKTHSALALRRQRMLFDRVADESGGRIVVDFDVTAELRPGYFGLPDVGPLFVENRYTDWRNYWPHQTLRSLWSLAHAVDPVRLRIEVLNPLRNAEQYAGDPLAPSAYRPDTLFAIAMAASPLGWFETTGLSPETVTAMRPLVEIWRRERARFHGGDIVPVGERPDGAAWTGFVSADANGQGGYALLFRELNTEAEYVQVLSGLLPEIRQVSVLAGRGSAELDKGNLRINSPAPLDYLWVRLEV